MSSNDPVFLTRELAEDLKDLSTSYRRDSLIPTRSERRRASTGRPPLRGILLEDLTDGGSADCAVTIYESTTTIQKISLLGDPSAGNFTLSFKGLTTASIPWNATPQQVQAALGALLSIGINNVVVSLGAQTYLNDAGQATPEFPGVWLVNFVGPFAGRTDTPLLVPNAAGIRANTNSVMVAATSHWVDTGKVEVVKAVIPVGTPTPMRAGAVIAAIHWPGFGYGVIACEPRIFTSFYYY